MNWTNEKVLDLIECYKNKPVLWFPKDPKYYNKFAKSDAWDDLAKEMKITPDECRKKITSLNASFRREKMKTKNSQRTGTGTDEVYESTWFAFKHFAFIMDKDNPRPTLDTVVTEQVEIENQNKEPEVDVLQSTENLNDSVIFNTPSSHPKKKEKNR
ncbi:uncharacterized protein LOC111041792 [Myzus persicae]|uniref:uncharacterized protein LOC111041792 n=1 Tax=Myzus persicae TaxID=13164 RepID=UPI000B936AFD|nr:uncharacterized protein LOC111041792 [Myzus persicae]